MKIVLPIGNWLVGGWRGCCWGRGTRWSRGWPGSYGPTMYHWPHFPPKFWLIQNLSPLLTNLSQNGSFILIGGKTLEKVKQKLVVLPNFIPRNKPEYQIKERFININGHWNNMSLSDHSQFPIPTLKELGIRKALHKSSYKIRRLLQKHGELE